MKPRLLSTARLSFPLASAIGALITGHSAQAASQTWDGGGADANWSTATNWVGDPTAPGATSGTTNTDAATFNAAIANTWGLIGSPILIDAGRNIGGINFDLLAGNYFIGTTAGSPLLLTSGGTIQILSTLTATNALETINAPLQIQGAGGTYTFANNSANGTGAGAGTLRFAGGITGGAAGATVLTLSGSNTNANTISGIIANGSATTLAVTKSGAGTWVLTGLNTYTGATRVNQGTLTLSSTGTNNRVLAITSALVLGGGTFNVNNGTTSAGTNMAQTVAGLTVNSGASKIALAQGAGTTNKSVALTLGAISRTAGSGSTVNFVQPAGTLTAGSNGITTTTGNVNSIIGPWATFGTGSAMQYAVGSTSGATLITGLTGTAAAAGADVTSTLGTVNYNVATSITDGSGTMAANASVNTLRYLGTGGTLTVSTLFTTNGIMNVGNGALTISGTSKIGANKELVFTGDGNITMGDIQESAAGASSLTASGTRILTLTGSNNYTGNTVINSGALSIAATGALPGFDTSGRYSVASGATLAVYNAVTDGNITSMLGTTNFAAGSSLGFDTTTLDRIYSATLANTAQGALGLTKLGANKLTLDQANTYTGVTTINAGTLALSGGNNRLLSTGTLAFTGASTFDIGSTSQTLAAITVPDLAGFTSTITGSGGTLTINGASDLQWGPGGAVGTNSYDAVVNLSGLSNFVFDASANTFRVGYKPGVSNGTGIGSSTVILAASNTITATNLNIADQGSSNNGGTGTLHLGAANTLNVANINVGTGGRSNATLDFNATSSAVTIRNTDGSSAVTSWTIGKVGTTNSTTWTDAVDFSNGTVDALVTTMNIGNAEAINQTNRLGTTNASFTMAGGTLTVGTMNLGQFLVSGTGSVGNTSTNFFAGNGTFTLNSASGTVNVTTLNLATNTGVSTGTATKQVSGTFHLTDGILNATTIQKGTQGGSATATTAFNWTTGTIGNIAGGNLAITNVPITLLTAADHTFNISGSNTATVDANSTISGLTFGITKTGTGTLTLNAANTYTGSTTISGGKLALAGSGSIASSPTIIVGASTTFDVSAVTGGYSLTTNQTISGSGTVAGAMSVSGTLSPGNSPGILTTGSQTWLDGGDYNFQMLDATGAAGTGFDQIAVTGTLDLSSLTAGGFNINLWSLSSILPDVNGDALSFDNALTQSWTILTTTAGITGFDAANFIINVGAFNGTNGFSNALGGGGFSLGTASNDLVLTFTAIPEPNVAALLGGVGALMLLRRRRN